MKTAPFVLALFSQDSFGRRGRRRLRTRPRSPDSVMGQHNSNAPINISSDNFVGDLQTKVGTYIGNVIVIQADGQAARGPA